MAGLPVFESYVVLYQPTTNSLFSYLMCSVSQPVCIKEQHGCKYIQKMDHITLVDKSYNMLQFWYLLLVQMK